MYPRTPSPRKRGHRPNGGDSSLPLPPPPLFQVPEGQSNFDEKLYSNALKLHRKSPSRHKSWSPKDWDAPVDSWEERYVPSASSSPFSPSMFYSPSPSMMTATTAPMTGTPTEIDLHKTTTVNNNNQDYIPVTLVSPLPAVAFCHPISPSYAATPPPPPSITRHYGCRTPTTPTSRHSYYNNNSPSPGYSTPRRLKTHNRAWTANSYASLNSPPTLENVNRKQRLKTELCKHWKEGRECPWGPKCTYAHGEEELVVPTLSRMQREGMIEDAQCYRTKPCWTYVATGACPFGLRCVSLHDPRVTGAEASWLPQTESQGNSLNTDINVDGLHQKRLRIIQQGNPFGDDFCMEKDHFDNLYEVICNTTAGNHHNKRRRQDISEMHKLSIALQMRGEAGWMYKYRPQHVIHNTICMVLQKRAFRLEMSGEAIPISLSKYQAGRGKYVLVRELAFGPDSDPSERAVALYFNIQSDYVTELTPQQAKRFRLKKNYREGKRFKISMLDSEQSFAMIRPFQKDAFEFATRILKHRYDTVKAEKISVLTQHSAVTLQLRKEKEELKHEFRIHKRIWINWSWPICAGRESVDEDTLCPPVDTEYIPIVDSDAINSAVKGSAIQPFWDSFIAQARLFKVQTAKCNSEVKKNLMSSLEQTLAPQTDTKRRLAIFKRLASGYQVCQNRNLPHIKSNTKKNAFENQIRYRSSERCWKDLLLKDDDLAKNEWAVILEHFGNSRTKKTLECVQH